MTIDLNGHMINRNAVNSDGTGIVTSNAGRTVFSVSGNLTLTSTNNSTSHVGYLKERADNRIVWIPGDAPNGEEVVVVNGGLICSGSGDSTSRVGGALNCLKTSNVAISNISFYGHAANYGAICAQGGAFSLTNCTFKYNLAGNYGGALYIGNNSNTPGANNITNCTFEHNVAVQYFGFGSVGYRAGGGGAIFMRTDANANPVFTVNIDNCKFDSNTAPDGGAVSIFTKATGNGLQVNQMKCIVKNSIFTNNKSITAPGARNAGGGAIDNVCSVLEVFDSIFENNSAYLGGAISSAQNRGAGASLYIHSGVFKNNEAFISGGAIYSQYTLFQLVADDGKEILITGNKAKYDENNNGAAVVVSATSAGVYLGGKVTVKDNEGEDLLLHSTCSNINVTKDLEGEGVNISLTAGDGFSGAGKAESPRNINVNVSANVDKSTIVESIHCPDMPGEYDPVHNKYVTGGAINEQGQFVVTVEKNEEGEYVPKEGAIIVSKITIAPCTNGTITTDVGEANMDDVVTINVVPNDGYHLSLLQVIDDIGNSVPMLSENTFKAPMRNVKIVGSFVPNSSQKIETEAIDKTILIEESNDNNSNWVEPVKEPEKKFIVQAAPKKEEKKEEPAKDFGIKVNDGSLKVNYHPNSKTSITVTNLDALKAMSKRIVSDLKYYKDSENAPLYIDDLDEDAILKIIENNEEITLEPYYSFDDEKYVISEDTDRMNDFVSKISDSHDGKTIFSLELGINIMANGKKIGSINELSEPLEYKIQFDSDAFKDSKDRYLYLITYHKGEYSYKPLQIGGDGSVVFTSQQFSPFRVISTKTSLLVNSTSINYILGVFFVGVLLLIALITILVVRSKKKHYINNQILVNQNIKF